MQHRDRFASLKGQCRKWIDDDDLDDTDDVPIAASAVDDDAEEHDGWRPVMRRRAFAHIGDTLLH